MDTNAEKCRYGNDGNEADEKHKLLPISLNLLHVANPLYHSIRSFSRSACQTIRPLLHLCNSSLLEKFKNIYFFLHWEREDTFSVGERKASARSHESFLILLDCIG